MLTSSKAKAVAPRNEAIGTGTKQKAEKKALSLLYFIYIL